jgi:hypothetical protein
MAEDPTTQTNFIPEQIRRQAARAEELQRELAAERGDETLPLEEGSQHEGEGHTTGSGGGPPPSETRVEERAAAPPVDTRTARHTTDWEQRYRTLQGKYDAETSGLRAQVASMERLLATMQSPAPQSQVPQTPPPAGSAATFNQEDIDLYGEDFLQAAARAAAARYEPMIARLENTIQRLEGGQQNISAMQIRDQVFEALDKDPELDGWREINTNPEFINWLQGQDEYAGVPRNQMLQHAYSNGDAIRTGRFFKKYMAEHTVPQTYAAPQTGRTPRPNSNGNGRATAARTRLEDLVVPGRAAGGSGGSDGAPQPRFWSRPEISRFYRDRTEGRYKGREQEGEALERDILAAASEGRVLA